MFLQQAQQRGHRAVPCRRAFHQSIQQSVTNGVGAVDQVGQFLSSRVAKQLRFRQCLLLLQPDQLAGGQPQTGFCEPCPDAMVVSGHEESRMGVICRAGNAINKQSIRTKVLCHPPHQ